MVHVGELSVVLNSAAPRLPRQVASFTEWMEGVRERILDRGGYPPAFEHNLQVRAGQQERQTLFGRDLAGSRRMEGKPTQHRLCHKDAGHSPSDRNYGKQVHP